jgi:CheY-like chemotaxis protein
MSKPTQILMMDDDEEQCLAVKDVLAEEGYNVTTVSDGAQALRYLDRMSDMGARLPALILLDLAMPGMNGREFLLVLERHPLFGKLPVAICTAKEQIPVSRLVVGVLNKPFRVEALLALVAKATGGPMAEPQGSPRAA